MLAATNNCERIYGLFVGHGMLMRFVTSENVSRISDLRFGPSSITEFVARQVPSLYVAQPQSTCLLSQVLMGHEDQMSA